MTGEITDTSSHTSMDARFSLISAGAFAGFGVVATSIIGGTLTGLATAGVILKSGNMTPIIALTIAQFVLYIVYFTGQISFAKKHKARLLTGALITGLVWNALACIFFFLNYFALLVDQEIAYAIMSATVLALAGVHTILRGAGLRKLASIGTTSLHTMSTLFILAGAGILFVPLLPGALAVLLVADIFMSRLLLRDAKN